MNVNDRIGFLRQGLFAEHVEALSAASRSLAINGAMEVRITYRGIKSSLDDAPARRRKQPRSGSSNPCPTSTATSPR